MLHSLPLKSPEVRPHAYFHDAFQQRTYLLHEGSLCCLQHPQ
jgi:hypothetical protein